MALGGVPAWLAFWREHQLLDPGEPEFPPHTGPRRGCRLQLDALADVPLPAAAWPVPDASEAADGAARVRLGLRVSCYDEVNHAFFGRTWRSPLVPATVGRQGALRVATAAPLACDLFYHTAVDDPGVYGVLEVVAEITAVAATATAAAAAAASAAPRLVALGWATLPLFSAAALGQAPRAVPLWAGTPRALLQLDGPLAAAPAAVLRPLPLGGVRCTLALHAPALALADLGLLPEHGLYSVHDALPGVASPASLALAPAPQQTYFVQGLRVDLLAVRCGRRGVTCFVFFSLFFFGNVSSPRHPAPSPADPARGGAVGSRATPAAGAGARLLHGRRPAGARAGPGPAAQDLCHRRAQNQGWCVRAGGRGARGRPLTPVAHPLGCSLACTTACSLCGRRPCRC